MSTSIYVHVHVHVYIYVSVYIYICVYVHVFMCVCVWMSLSHCVCLSAQPDEPPASVFNRGESLEFRQQDYRGAIEAFRQVARSPDSTIRAGGLLRLGRALRKANRRKH